MKYPKALLSARGSKSEAYAVSMERGVWVLHGAKAPDRRGEGGATEKAGPMQVRAGVERPGGLQRNENAVMEGNYR